MISVIGPCNSGVGLRSARDDIFTVGLRSAGPPGGDFVSGFVGPLFERDFLSGFVGPLFERDFLSGFVGPLFEGDLRSVGASPM
jgi:hypothetical protein